MGLGNPYELGRDGDRPEVLVKFTDYCVARMAHDPKYYQMVMALKDKDMVCWCKPLSCHGDVYFAIANEVKEWQKPTGRSSAGGSF